NINYCTISQNIYLIMERLSQSTDNDNSDSILLPAIQLLLGDRYDITTTMLAEACNISDVYFRKIFKNKYGISPSKHLIQRKVDKAKHYLTYTDMNINEISYLLNFIDTSYFCKQFKQIVGTTPNNYRNKTSHTK
ncbi:MAG: helix-turn-helix transcriptional regulator, partial [Clostridia bacterium]|nr:helix-turn-helix transcriptional regulator [Clostridia bacterium]